MSMDDQYEQLRRFSSRLAHANSALHAASQNLARAHERVDHDWQDALRREYDRLYSPLGDRVTRYLHHDAPAYEQFLREKIQALNRYLYGD